MKTLTELKIELKEKNIDYCLNSVEVCEDDIKYIIVGDNPGVKEKEQNKYFVGTSGVSLRNFLTKKTSNFELVNESDFDSQILIRNKTFIHTNQTNGLKDIQKANPDLFNSIQEYCAAEIIKASRGEIPILIFGKSNIGEKKIFSAFWNKIKELDKIYIYNHPAYSCLNRECKDITCEKDFLELGKKNVERLKEKSK